MKASGETVSTHALNFMVVFFSGEVSSGFKHQFSVLGKLTDANCVADT